MRLLLLSLLASALGCESTYHPEYHPVTVTTVHQVHAGIVPVQPQPIVIEQPVLADPNIVFQR